MDLLALRKLAASLNAELNEEFEKSERAGLQNLSPRAEELLKALQGVAAIAMAAQE